MKILATMVAALLLVVTLSQAGMQDEPRTVRDYFELEVGYINLMLLTGVLERSDLDRWARILNASEAQEDFMQRQYAQFVAQHNATMDRLIPKHLALSAEADAIRVEHGTGSWELVEANRSLHRDNLRIREELARVERNYIDSLIPVLADEQVQRLEILRLAATRRQHGDVHLRVRWSKVELRRVWEMVDRELIAADEWNEIEAILLDYDRTLNKHTRRLLDSFWTQSTRLMRLFAERYADQSISPEEFFERHQRIMRQTVQPQLALARFNRQTSEEIAQALSGHVAAAFQQHLRESVFPELYPDQTALHGLFEALLDDDEVTDEGREVVTSLLIQYSDRHEKMCDDIEAFCVEWDERGAKGENGYQTQLLPGALKPKLQQRRDLAVETLHALAAHPAIADYLREHIDHVPGELREEIAEMLDHEQPTVADE